MPTTIHWNLNTDTTLGGDNASDREIASQRAIKSYVDNHSGGGGITVDNELSTTSENPVQNKVITNELADKQELLVVGDCISIEKETFLKPIAAFESSNTRGWLPLCFGDNYFLQIGSRGYVAYSSDGTTWTETPYISTLNIYSNFWWGLAYGNSKYVAISDTGYISTSTNRTTWTTATQVTNLGNRNWRHLVYDGTKFVAISSSGYISTSTNGTTWTSASQVSNLGSRSWTGIVYDGTKFVAISSRGYISTSTDGTTWTSASQILGSHSWRNLAYNGSMFVAVGDYGYISTSTDGTTWTTPVKNYNIGLYPTNIIWSDIAYGNGIFVVRGNGSDSGVVSIWNGSYGDNPTINVIVDTTLSSSSENPVQNKVVNTALNNKVSTSRTINGKALSSDITLETSDITNCENTTNKVTSLSSSSTDAQYPSAKCVYDLVGDVETLINAL